MILQIDNNGTLIEITVLDNPATVTRSEYLDFVKPIENWAEKDIERAKAEAAEIAEQVEENGDADSAAKDHTKQLTTPLRYFCTLAQMNGGTAEMCEAALKSLSVFTKSHLSFLPFHDESDDLLAMFLEGVDLFNGELTICRLLVYHSVLFSDYVKGLAVPTVDFSTEYKGETYYLEPATAKTLAEIATGRPRTKYPVKTIMEVSEWERVFAMKTEIEKGDSDGAIQFHLDMVTMAILLRKKGEEMPLNKTEREAWIDERAQHFQGLPLGTFFQVRFFLTTIFNEFARMSVLRAISEKHLNSKPTTLAGKWAKERAQKRIQRKFQALSTEPSADRAN